MRGPIFFPLVIQGSVMISPQSGESIDSEDFIKNVTKLLEARKVSYLNRIENKVVFSYPWFYIATGLNSIDLMDQGEIAFTTDAPGVTATYALSYRRYFYLLPLALWIFIMCGIFEAESLINLIYPLALFMLMLVASIILSILRFRLLLRRAVHKLE